jgi:hypothetical protein
VGATASILWIRFQKPGISVRPPVLFRKTFGRELAIPKKIDQAAEDLQK